MTGPDPPTEPERSWRHVGDRGRLRAACRATGVSERELVRAALAVVLAARAGEPEVSLAEPRGGNGDVVLASTTLDPALPPAAAHWSTGVASLRRGSASPRALRELIGAARLPAFRFGRSSEAGAAAAFPLEVTARPTDGAVELSIRARARAWSAAALEALGDQVEHALAMLLADPRTPAGDVADSLPPGDFELVLAGNEHHQALAHVVRYWAAEVGLPLELRLRQLGELPQPLAPQRFPTPRRRGAAVLVTRASEWRPPPPDLGRLAEVNPNETRQTYEEIFVRRAYVRHGVRIPPGATVVDVGANIGLFTLFAHHAAPDVVVHAVEPVAELADLARANARAHGAAAVVHEVALGASTGVAKLTYYPRSTLQSSVRAERATDEATVRRYALNQALATGVPLGPGAGDVDGLLPGRFETEVRSVPRSTVSQLIDEQGLEAIALLKIDVERAEEDVLDGVREEHWPRIQQVAVEVHDDGGRADRVVQRLRERGFHVAAEQDPLFTATELVMVYARRARDEAPDGADAVEAILAAAAGWAERSALPVHVAVGGEPEEIEPVVRRARELPGVGVIPLAAPGRDRDTIAASDGTDVMRHVTAPLRPPAKVIAVDADGTLWDGVCGEVGPDQVVVDEPHRRLQRALRDYRSAGLLLVLCSRNNPADVEATFAAHPGMPLRLSDFAATRVDWGSKAENLASLAAELGIAPEAIVFVDDDAAVRDEVRLRRPEVTVVEPGDPADFAAALERTWAFSLDPETEEDRLRATSVAQEARRREVGRTAGTFREYLEHLALRVDVTDAGPGDAERIGQLARRTSQFNLCLRRHTDADVRHLLATMPVALCMRVEDRFGQYGLVGFAAATVIGGVLHTTDLMLSCRALGRNVEWAMLRALGERARALGASRVRLSGVRGARNAPVLAFLAAVAAHTGEGARADALDVEVDAERLAQLRWREIEASPAPEVRGRADAGAHAAGRRYRWPAPEPHGLAELAQRVHRLRGTRPALATPLVPPREPTELLLAEVWADVLGIDGLGIHDDLFALGGDSLAAVAICAAVQRRGGGDVPLEALLDRPTIAGMAAALASEREPADDGDHGAPAPASSEASDGQRRAWAAERTAAVGGSQVIPLVFDIRGQLAVERLEAALAELVRRHEALHSVLVPRGDVLLRESASLPFELVCREVAALDAPEATAAACEVLSAPFDLEHELPMRGLLLRAADGGCRLVLAVHHAAADGASVGVLQRDLGLLYDGGAPLEPAPAFSRYVEVLRTRERNGQLEDAVHAVAARLPPRGDPAAGGPPPRPQHRRVPLDREVADAVDAVARTRATSRYVVHLAAFGLVVARHRDDDLPVVGELVANRRDPRHAETVGFLANIVPIPLRLEWTATLEAHLAAVAGAHLEALRHASVPYGLLLRRQFGDPYRFAPPPFDALFTQQPPPSHPLRLRGCAVVGVEPPLWPLPFPLMVDVAEQPGDVSLLLRYDAARFAEAEAASLVDAHVLVLEALARLPHLPLSVLRDVLDDLAGDARRSGLAAAARARRAELERLSGSAQ